MEKLYEKTIKELYERGVNWKRRENIYDIVDLTHRFYNGDQWKGLDSGSIKPIVYNIIKSMVKYKIGVVNSNDYEIVFSANNIDNEVFQKEVEDVAKYLNRYVADAFEFSDMYRDIRKAIKDSCITGEGILYFDYSKEKDEAYTTVIPMSNISYGNENDADIQTQPYILINFERPVDEVREEAIRNGMSKKDAEMIVGDEYEFDAAGDKGKEAINAMVTCIAKLYKKTDKKGNTSVWCEKGTSNGITYKKDYNTGLKRYPVVHINWEDVEGSARGVGAVYYNIPNQIEVNRTAMRRAIATKMSAYPKLAAVVDRLKNPEDLNAVGIPLEINGQGATADDIKKLVGYVSPTSMSKDAQILQNELMDRTRELEGAGDSVTGEVNPEEASGKAILAVQQASQQPLLEQVNKIKFMYEEIAATLIDFWKTYTKGSKTINVSQEVEVPEQGTVEQRVPYKITKSKLDKMKMNIKIDVTPKTAYDKLAQELTLDNYLASGLITFEERVAVLDETSNMPTKKLQEIVKAREVAKQQMMQQKMQMDMLFQQFGQNMNQQQREIEAVGGPAPEELVQPQ